MQPLYQIQLLPGVHEIPVGIIPLTPLVAKWAIDIPLLGQPPKGIVTVLEDVEGVGDIYLGGWKLEPSTPLDRSPLLVPILMPPRGRLRIETAGYSVSRLSLYGYGVPDRSLPTQPNSMGISFAPYVPPAATVETINTVPASTAAVSVVGNPNRLGGYIENKANKSMWIKWGASAAAPALTAALPFTEVPPGGNISIDAGYTGVISMIWSAGVTVTTNAYVHELIA